MNVGTTTVQNAGVSAEKLVRRGSCLLTQRAAHGWSADVHYVYKQLKIAMTHARNRENCSTNHIALVTAAQHVSVHVYHMTMTAVNHNAHSRGNNWTNHFVVGTVVMNVNARTM